MARGECRKDVDGFATREGADGIDEATAAADCDRGIVEELHLHAVKFVGQGGRRPPAHVGIPRPGSMAAARRIHQHAIEEAFGLPPRFERAYAAEIRTADAGLELLENGGSNVT